MTAASEKLKTQREVARLSVDAFVRSVAVNRGRPVCFLLGAGSSISSGMPSAQRCIWEWKRDIFVTQNPLLRESVGELSLPGTRQRIQRWLDQRGSYPAAGSPAGILFLRSGVLPNGTRSATFLSVLRCPSKAAHRLSTSPTSRQSWNHPDSLDHELRRIDRAHLLSCKRRLR